MDGHRRTVALTLCEALLQAALRAAALLLIALALLGAMAGALYVVAAIQTMEAQTVAPVSAEAAAGVQEAVHHEAPPDDTLLLPAKEPCTSM